MTRGEVLVNGHSIRQQGARDRARACIGVCPQFDVLLGQLTAREHLHLFGAIRGLPAKKLRAEAQRVRIVSRACLTPAAVPP